jgi:hypothetical protein
MFYGVLVSRQIADHGPHHGAPAPSMGAWERLKRFVIAWFGRQA